MQESDSTRATQTTTDYYNNLIIQQADYYEQAAAQEIIIADLNDKLESLEELPAYGDASPAEDPDARELAESLPEVRE